MSEAHQPDSMPAGMDSSVRKILHDVAAGFGTPCYVYLLDAISDRVRLISRVFGKRFEISYAVKANPNIQLLGALAPYVANLDVSSGGELSLAVAAGYGPHRISFTGPGKSEEELTAAIDAGCGEIVVESLDEVADIDRVSCERGYTTRILLRISPQSVPRGFGVTMAGRPSQFGLDEEVLDAAMGQLTQYMHVYLAGFHIYAGTQCLIEDSIVENFRNCIRIFSECAERHGITPEMLVFGSGIGVPYYPGDHAVDLHSLAERVNPMLDELRARPAFRKARFILETGRLLVGEAGYFLTTVRRLKCSRGKNICICDGGLNNHLAACGHFGTVIHRNYLITRLNGDGTEEGNSDFDVFGPLCTMIDQLARKLSLPALNCGDVLAIHNSGAYGFTASPMRFISRPFAKEIIVRKEGAEHLLLDASVGPW